VKGRRAREMRILTPAEYQKLLQVVPPQHRLLVECLVHTGLRFGEAAGLQARDITPRGTGYVIRVRRVVIEVGGRSQVREYGKTANASREIPVDAELGEALIAQANSDPGRNPEGFLFRADRGGRLQRSNFRRIWLAALKAAGLEGVRVHDLRHYADGWVMCPAVAFPLLGAAELVLQSA
jgi:integrase